MSPDTAAGPARQPGPWQPRKRVTVLGAGVAGLVAAYELERLGHSVEVLEGHLRVGGRIRTHRFLPGRAGPLVELGAMRLPATHHRTMRYLRKLGLADQLREFTTLFQDDAAYVRTGQGHRRIREASETLVAELRGRLSGGEAEEYSPEALLFGAWMAVRVNALAPSDFRDSIRQGLDQELLDLVAGIELADYVRSPGAGGELIDLRALFADHPQIRAGCRGRLFRFVDDIVNETGSTLMRLSGGLDQLTHRLRERIRGPVRCGQEVTGLAVDGRGVELRIRQGFGTVTRSCDYVLCTIPFSVLRGLDLAGLDEEKLAAIHDQRYWAATKVAFHCREAFWERDGITGGASFTGGLIRQTYYPPVEGDPKLGAALLASYTIGQDADRLCGLGRGPRIAAVLAEAAVVHPELRRPGMVLGVADQVWGTEPSAQGAAAVRWGKDAASCEEERQAMARPQGRLFFAGEHCSAHPAWVEGAVESAQQAVRLIDGHQHGGSPADSALAADAVEEPA
ncbi:FAD-dependent oxidoreductase [Kitasatospora sp. NBC_01287]|uniref:flavin monoamine oxidase family protein n=1 Tax=Kitasatospora sp. NBC_01287 TaxID=2903573 RepID=UPI00224DEB74|nr:NAD(P)/FAD-dependent oxidoreductase [Kitasatospora sp. NBC_01287]MCX4749996.1 FAD-dependent oxidoreductase [Kitasatospora sp. NBC_01287]